MRAPLVGFHITNRCQLNCDHCLRDPELQAIELDPDLIARVLDRVQPLLGVRRVGLTGGEPTLHARFWDIIDRIADRGIPWHIVSNGALLPRMLPELHRRARRLETFHGAYLSLDGADAAVHDAIRGPGNFEAILQAASLLRAIDRAAELQFTVQRRNLHQLEALAMLGGELGVTAVHFAPLYATGTPLDASLRLSLDEQRLARDRIQRLQGMFRFPVTWSVGFPSDVPFQQCAAWQLDELHIDNHGRLNLCCIPSGMPVETAPGELPTDVAADLATTDFDEALGRLLDIIHRTRQARIEALARGEHRQNPLLALPCNWCLRHHGRPWWDAEGTEGPEAQRPRWRGAWALGSKPSHREAGLEPSGGEG